MFRMRHHAHDDDWRPRAKAVDDLPLFAAPSVAVATSEAAAARVRPTVKDAHQMIIALLIVHGALTDHEIRTRTGWSESYGRPRRWELEGMGVLEKCDGQHGRPLLRRPTDTGSLAYCYQLTAQGRERAKGDV